MNRAGEAIEPTAAATSTPAGAAACLRTTAAVRKRAHALLARARRGESRWFRIDDARLADAARLTIECARARYPSSRIPFHSRWRHFEAGGVDRVAELDRLLEGRLSPRESLRARIDLVVVSVLLDAGAGAGWHYDERASGRRFTRSEGLAVASFHAFVSGLFSSDARRPLQADGAGLRTLQSDRLGAAFQVRHDNPLVGLEPRAQLLRRLGEAMAQAPDVFGPQARPAGLLDALAATTDRAPPSTAGTLQAHAIFDQVLRSFSCIWPSANAIEGIALGDCWRHSAVRGPGLTDGWMPFHKLSQWLTYSLLEPFAEAGFDVTGLEALTGLPEYRNGGLFLDTGVVGVRQPALLERTFRVGDEFVVEWRALTVALLDELAFEMRRRLSRDEAALPLASVLEGGTWAAGRELAQRLRNGLPPLRIDSDGTVF